MRSGLGKRSRHSPDPQVAFPKATPPRYPISVRTALLLLVALPVLFACGPKLPPRYVIEKDVGAYRFRRYQQVLDVEIGIEGNDALGHTASYVRSGKTVLVAPVFITVYRRAAGLTETVRQRLRGMQGYTFDIVKVKGENLFRMRGQGEGGDSWLLWVSGPQLVKLGAPEGENEVPEELLDLYLETYPSDLDAKGKAKDGSSSQGPAPGGETAGEPPGEPTPTAGSEGVSPAKGAAKP